MVPSVSQSRLVANLLRLVLPVLALSCGAEESTGPGGNSPDAPCPAPSRLLADGRCVPPGVQDNGCPAGTVWLEDGSCLPAGIPPERCGEGFAPDGNQKFKLDAMHSLKGEALDEAPGGGWKVRIPLPRPVGDMALLSRMFESSNVESAKKLQ